MIPIYFDTEFTGLHQYTKLISIGMVSTEGNTFYGEFSDFESGFVSEEDRRFFKERLKPHLHLQNHKHNYVCGEMLDYTIFGDSKCIAKELSSWLLLQGKGETVQMWSDCLAYDWMLFCNLWGHALDLPSHISYIPMDLSTLLWAVRVNPDIGREEYAGLDKNLSVTKHNALHDAHVIKLCSEKAMKHLNNERHKDQNH